MHIRPGFLVLQDTGRVEICILTAKPRHRKALIEGYQQFDEFDDETLLGQDAVNEAGPSNSRAGQFKKNPAKISGAAGRTPLKYGLHFVKFRQAAPERGKKYEAIWKLRKYLGHYPCAIPSPACACEGCFCRT